MNTTNTSNISSVTSTTNTSNLFSEFDFIMEKETTFEEDSMEFVNKAKEFISNATVDKEATYQGISLSDIADCIKIGKTYTMPWEHVTFVIDIGKLKYISGDKLEELHIPDFVEEIQGIEDNGTAGFGFNQTLRNKIKRIYIPKSVVTIKQNTFAFYTKLERVKIEEDSKLMEIGDNAFAYCNRLHKMNFKNCRYLDKLSMKVFNNTDITDLKINDNICKIVDTN